MMMDEINRNGAVAYEKLFPSQQPNEKIIIAVREHWFLLFVKVLAIALLSLLPWLFNLLLISTSVANWGNTATAIMSSLSSLYYLGLLVALFVVFTLYYLNLHVVSEDRIVDIDQVGLLFHQVSELNIETIEDVSSQTKGIFGNLLNYGTVFVQTAGAVERFRFDNVPNPQEISTSILELYENHISKEVPKP